MNDYRKKRKGNLSIDLKNYYVNLPNDCKDTVKTHINTVYVGSVLRVFDSSLPPEGCIVRANWITEHGLHVTFLEERRCGFIILDGKSWVVDNDLVFPGAVRLFRKPRTDDIQWDMKIKTDNETRIFNNKILMNQVVMSYPTERDRQTYECALFRLTCNCNYSLKVKQYTCSQSNPINSGRKYYGCCNKYNHKVGACNFFVWKDEIDHEQYRTCKCGKLSKQIKISSDNLPNITKFVCVNRRNKEEGCDMWED